MKSKMPEDEEVVLTENLEQLLWEINEFCDPNNAKQDKSDEIPPALENYLKYVAKSGNTVFPWQNVRPLFRIKMLHAINNFSGEACASEPFVLERFDLFRAAPFTIQRFSELITYPNRHYKLKEKFLRGLEKTVLVVTTVEPSTETSSVSPDSSPEASMDEISTTHISTDTEFNRIQIQPQLTMESATTETSSVSSDSSPEASKDEISSTHIPADTEFNRIQIQPQLTMESATTETSSVSSDSSPEASKDEISSTHIPADTESNRIQIQPQLTTESPATETSSVSSDSSPEASKDEISSTHISTDTELNRIQIQPQLPTESATTESSPFPDVH